MQLGLMPYVPIINRLLEIQNKLENEAILPYGAAGQDEQGQHEAHHVVEEVVQTISYIFPLSINIC